LELAKQAAQVADQKKATKILLLDLRRLSNFTDYFLICSGDNIIQLQAIADAIEESIRKTGVRPHHLEGYGTSGWILLDYTEVVIHVFLEKVRQFYGLELLWGDAPQVSWQ
jgi:ribosome-associated protein